MSVEHTLVDHSEIFHPFWGPFLAEGSGLLARFPPRYGGLTVFEHPSDYPPSKLSLTPYLHYIRTGITLRVHHKFAKLQ